MSGEVTAALGLLEEEDRLLMVANWRILTGTRVLCWDVPGGGVDPGESLEAACIREFREETGIHVVVRDLAFMVERFGFKSPDPTVRSAFYYFHVERAPGERGKAPSPEDADIVGVEFKDVPELQALCPHPYQQELLRWLGSGRAPRYFVHRREGPAAPGPGPVPGA